MDSLIAIALARPVTLLDMGGIDRAQSLSSICDAFAERVARRYLRGELSWAAADTAMSHILAMMTRCGHDRIPARAWYVYLAFDEGEYRRPGKDIVTRPLLADIGLMATS